MIVQRHIDLLVVPTRTVLFQVSRIVQEYISWVMSASIAGLCSRLIRGGSRGSQMSHATTVKSHIKKSGLRYLK